jgi:tripartite ATP-independent transporter DctM subunit
MIFIAFAVLGFLILIGVPVAIALAGSSIVYLVTVTEIPAIIAVQRMVEGVDSFPLLAVPLFILAGNLMNSAGITSRIFSFALALVGWLRGGLGHVNVVASIIFAGMSGAAVADAGGLGTIEIKAMTDAGYDIDFSVGITAASSTIGPIIPPSLPMVVYGVLANESIGRLFLAGVIPGLLMGVSLMLMVSWYARVRGYHRDATFSFMVLVTSFIKSFLSLITPLIILGGIILGIFTPTEAAAIACLYALILGVFVYKELDLKQILKVTKESIESTVTVLFVVAAATVFAWVLARVRITDDIAALLLALSDNRVVILLMINIVLFIVGFFMETIAAITILVPVLLPILQKVGIDTVQFGVIMTLNLMIGLLTPPVGVVLFVLTKIAKISFERTVAATAPFILPLVIVLFAVVLIPQLTLFLPNLLLAGK